VFVVSIEESCAVTAVEAKKIAGSRIILKLVESFFLKVLLSKTFEKVGTGEEVVAERVLSLV
jgi:hypothetical protein